MMATSDKRIEDISLILRDLLKVIKVVSMYPEDNPLPQSLRRSFAERLESLVEDYGELCIAVSEDSMAYCGDTVFRAGSKEENLAGLFYHAGITELSFKPQLEVLEIYKLLDVIRNYINGPEKSTDLAGLLWEAGINGFGLKTLEDVSLSEYDDGFNIQEYVSGESKGDSSGFIGTQGGAGYESIFSQDEDSGKWESGEMAGTGGLGPGHADGVVDIPSGMPENIAEIYKSGPASGGTVEYAELQDDSPGDALIGLAGESDGEAGSQRERLPNTTLILNDEFKLSEEEEELIRKLIEQDATFEPYTSTLELLKEMLLQEIDITGFRETVTICERMMGEFIRLGRLSEASSLLAHLRKLEARIRQERPRWADRLKEAYITAGSRGRLDALAASLNANSDINTAELKKYLSGFGWEAYAGITSLVGQLEHRTHRDAVLVYLSEHGKDNVDLVAKGIFDKSTDVVRNAMSILVRVADDRALKYLSRLTSHENPDIRMELVALLKECPNEAVLEILKRLVRDSNPQIRRAAVNAIVGKRGAPAFETIAELINDQKFPTLEEEDQQSLLNAFSTLGGEKALGYLTELITTHNYFRNRTLGFLRSAAFEALMVNRSEKAERVLLKMAKSWRPQIRRQALSALHRRRESSSGDF